jgi:phosphate starvation-inducible membrane PsiE
MKSVLFGDHSKHDHLLSAACAYVLLGLTFAYALIVIEAVTGTPQVHVAPENLVAGYDATALTRAQFLYLSFVTLTTLGFGDMTAVTLEARMVLGVEAVLGQLYLAIMVARLIALHTSAPGKPS